MRKAKNWASAAALLALTSVAQASLIAQGDGTVLDTDTNLIWLQNWAINGKQTWAAQNAWAEGLTFAGSSDWVLPSISQLLALYAEVGDLTKVSVFTGVTDFDWWSGTRDASAANRPNYMRSTTGHWGVASEVNSLFAVAVRSADASPSVPEPQSLALMLLAAGAALVAARKRPC